MTKAPVGGTLFKNWYSLGEFLDSLKKNLAGRAAGKELEQKYISTEADPKLSKEKKKRIPETPLPARLKYPKIWKDLRVAGISCPVGTSQTVIDTAPGCRSFITSITFTVDDEVDITLFFGNYGTSGPMDFGGSDEPRAIAQSFGDSPIPCGNGDFLISNDGPTGNIYGFVVYYQELDETP